MSFWHWPPIRVSTADIRLLPAQFNRHATRSQRPDWNSDDAYITDGDRKIKKKTLKSVGKSNQATGSRWHGRGKHCVIPSENDGKPWKYQSF
jgi:hypothetical protein